MIARRSILLSLVSAAIGLVAAALVSGCPAPGFTVAIDATPMGGRAPLSVTFTAALTGAGEDDTFTYAWDFGDGETSTGAGPNHIYTEGGTYTVVVTVTRTDDDLARLDSLTLTVQPNGQPVVEASATPTMGLAPLDVHFVATVLGGDGAIDYDWDFGDTGSSTEPSPTHTYTTAGSYDATVTVVDEDGDTDEATVSIAVGSDQVPAATASATPTSGAAPLAVEFTCVAVGGNAPLAYAWTFGDGSSSPLQDPAHTYTAAGTYSATCVVTDADGDMAMDTVVITVADDEAPVALASASPSTGDAPLTVSFTGVGIGGDAPLTFSWIFGDGGTSALQNPTHDYTASGTYEAILTVTDADGDFSVDSVTITVNIPNGAPVVDAGIDDGSGSLVDTYCALLGEMIALDATGTTDPEGDVLTYNWIFVSVPAGSMAAFNNDEIANPTFVPDLYGMYLVRVIVSDGLHPVASDLLTVNAAPPAAITKVSGDGQTGTVGEPLAEPLVAELVNGCGRLMPDTGLTWTGANASPWTNWTTTDVDGLSTNNAGLGSVAGAASIIVASEYDPAVLATFNFTALPGPAYWVLMSEAGELPASDTYSGALTFILMDQFTNPTTSTSAVTFDVDVSWSSAWFCNTSGDPNFLDDFEIPAGSSVATVDICDTSAEDVFVNLYDISPASLMLAGMHTFFFDDMESGEGDWWTEGYVDEFELGAPTFGPAGAHSGANVWGTVLDGEYTAYSTDWHSYLGHTFEINYPGFVMMAVLTFYQWFDIAYAFTGDCDEGAFGVVFSPWYGILDPLMGGYNASSSCYGIPAWAGATPGWTQVAMDLSWAVGAGPIDYYWAFLMDDSLETAAGWYIDDVMALGIVNPPMVRFVPGPPASVSLFEWMPGYGTCEEAAVVALVADDFGNDVRDSGVQLDFSFVGTPAGNAQFTGVLAPYGQGFSGAGTTASVETVDGVVALYIGDDAAETLTVQAELPGVSGSAGTTPVDINAAGSTEATCDDRRDDDCDGYIDCGDTDCSGEWVGMWEFNTGTTEGWTISNSDAVIGWQVDHNRAGSDPFSIYYGDPATRTYGVDNSGTFTSYDVDLSGSPELWFQLWAETESCCDGLNVNVIDSVGTNTIWSFYGSTGGWTWVGLDLSAWAGETVQIQFEFVDDFSIDYEGVYIDDIYIDATCP